MVGVTNVRALEDGGRDVLQKLISPIAGGGPFQGAVVQECLDVEPDPYLLDGGQVQRHQPFMGDGGQP